MAGYLFAAPPLPYYISSGLAITGPGWKHASRRNVGIFDLLVVTKGCLYMGEEDRTFEVRAGHMLILHPHRRHFATKAGDETTECYWVHFQAGGYWETIEPSALQSKLEAEHDVIAAKDPFAAQTLHIRLERFAELQQPAKVIAALDRLAASERRLSGGEAGWEKQLLFLEVLRLLSAGQQTNAPSPAAVCAQHAAAYLREHYREEVTAEALGDSLNFHPVYIARCMQKEFGCPPFEYLLRFRIEQAKLLLLRTDLPMHRVAEEVGFRHASYFSTCFLKYEGITPRQYRGRFTES